MTAQIAPAVVSQEVYESDFELERQVKAIEGVECRQEVWVLWKSPLELVARFC